MFPELITELLQDGYKVSFSAPGHSMYPTIMANETIMVEPIDPVEVKQGDIILYRNNGRLIAHRVICIKKIIKNLLVVSNRSENLQSLSLVEGDSPLIESNAYQFHPVEGEVDSTGVKRSSNEVLHFVLRGDASVTCDEPVTVEQILGKVVAVERNGCRVDPYCFSHKLDCFARRLSSRFKSILN